MPPSGQPDTANPKEPDPMEIPSRSVGDNTSRIRFLEIKAKDIEKEMDYLARCVAYLDSKASRSDEDQQESQRRLRKFKKLNKALQELWTDLEVEKKIAKFHAEGRSIFPIVNTPFP